MSQGVDFANSFDHCHCQDAAIPIIPQIPRGQIPFELSPVTKIALA